MATAAVSDEGIFECAICLGSFEEPKLLPCFHTFCKNCLNSYIKKSRKKKNLFQCPNCRTDIKIPPQEADGFQTNFYITAAKNSQENLQSKLLDITIASRKGSRQAEAGDGMLFDQPCPKHGSKNQMLQFYCARCDIPICLHCKLTSHEGHDTRDLEDILHSTEEELKEQSEKIQAFVSLYNAARSIAEESEKKFDHKLQELKASIIGNAEHLHDMVDNRKKVLLDMLSKSQRKETNKVVQYKKNLEKNSRQMTGLMDDIKSEKNKHDITVLLKLKSNVGVKMKGLNTVPPKFTSTNDEVSYTRTANLNKKVHETISNFMGQVVIAKDESNVQASAQPTASSASATYEITYHIPTLLRTVWSRGRNKFVVRSLCTETQGRVWAIYDPISPDMELLNKNGATLKKLNIKGNDISGLTLLSSNRLVISCPSRKVMYNIDNIYSPTVTQHIREYMMDTPVAVTQYNGQVYVLIWGKGSARGVYRPDTEEWLIRNSPQLMMKKPFDFVVTKVNGKVTIIISDPVGQKVMYFQENRGTYHLLAVYKGEKLEQQRTFQPKGISLTNKGHLLVADEGNSFIVQLDMKTGKLIGIIHLENVCIRKPRVIRYTQECTWIGDAFGGLYLISYDSPNSYEMIY